MKKNPKLFYIAMALFSVLIIALDQWTKWLTVKSIPLGETRWGISGIFYLTHVENTGGAWGIFGGSTWLFVVVLVLFVGVLGFLIYKKWLTKKFEFVCLAGILGGGIGNLIDRLATGRVTDMIAFDFMKFPVFNVADCFITVGCFALIVYVLFFDRSKSKQE